MASFDYYSLKSPSGICLLSKLSIYFLPGVFIESLIKLILRLLVVLGEEYPESEDSSN